MLYEWRNSVARKGAPVLAEEPPSGANFRSVFGFPKNTASIIRQQGNMKDLGGKVLYCDKVLIDIDKPENVTAVQAKLEGIGYEIWDTGHRGCHIEIPLAHPLISVNTPYSVTVWLRSVGVWDLIDTSVYKPASQFRTAGAVHQKTGRLKSLVMTVDGRQPTIQLVTPPPKPPSSYFASEGTPETVMDFLHNLMLTRGPGERHMHLYILFKSGQRAGIELEELKDYLHWWNSRFAVPPHTARAVDRKIRGFL